MRRFLPPGFSPPGGQACTLGCGAHPRASREIHHQSPATRLRPPSVLIVGSPMVRNITLPAAKTLCYPGAHIQDIDSKIPQLLDENPSTTTIIIHVGTNDLRNNQSETLKKDFMKLMDSLLQTDRKFVVSGPLPCPSFGNIKFRRVLQLHTWLKGYCCSLNILFVDNFGTLLDHPYFFRHDGVHHGSRLLAMNMELTLKSSLHYWCVVSPACSTKGSNCDSAIQIPVYINHRPRSRNVPVTYRNQNNLLLVWSPTISPPQSHTPQIIKMALLNIRSLTNKSFIVNDLISTHNLDFTLLTET